MAVRVHGPGRATRVGLMAAGSARSVPRAANSGRPDMELTRADETMVRTVVELVGRAV